MIRYPQFLMDHQTIEVIAPSFGASFEPYITQIKEGIKTLQSLGYCVNVGMNVFKNDGVGISSSPRNCGRELMNAFRDDSHAVISVGGGELMCTILPYVNFNELTKDKWFMGFSDNTNFSFLYTTLNHVASINAINLNSMAYTPWHESVSQAFDLLTGQNFHENTYTFNGYTFYEKESLKDENNPLMPLNCQYEVKHVYANMTDSKLIQGRLLSGTLDCLVTLCGTKFDKVKDFIECYREDGIVWVMDACDLNCMDISRAFWQLKEAGWFKYCKGFIFGRPLCDQEVFINLNQYDAVTNILSDLNVPIVMDFEYGHFAPSIPLVNGCLASFDFNDTVTKITYTYK